MGVTSAMRDQRGGLTLIETLTAAAVLSTFLFLGLSAQDAVIRDAKARAAEATVLTAGKAISSP